MIRNGLLIAALLAAAACGRDQRATENGFARDTYENQPTAVAGVAAENQNAAPENHTVAKGPDADPLLAAIGTNDLVRLPGYLANSVNIDRINQRVFQMINEDRKAAGLKPVLWDPIGAKAGAFHAKEELDAHHWLSHYSLNGDLPYMRYSRAGGYDANAENAATLSISSLLMTTDGGNGPEQCRYLKVWPIPTPMNIENELETMAATLHCKMVNEKPPMDGHRQTILDPHATAVGVSVGIDYGPGNIKGAPESQITLYLQEEFETRGLSAVSAVPLEVNLKKADEVLFSGEIVPGLKFDQARLYFEKLVEKNPEQVADVLHYEYPSSFALIVAPLAPGMVWSAETKKKFPDLRSVARLKDNAFTLPLDFKYGPGVYTVNVIATDESKNLFSISTRSFYVK